MLDINVHVHVLLNYTLIQGLLPVYLVDTGTL